jgi:NAD(P)H-hydrate epimerase
MIVLTAEESRELDRRTIEAGTASEVLMERAAKGVFEFLRERFDLTRERFWVECGKGNNGEDGAIVARLLRQAGAIIDRDAATVIVDAILGTGLRGPASGRALEQIRWIEAQSSATVVAIDVPSGLGSGGEHVTADYTVAIGTLKPVHVLPPECDACGEVQVLDIGLLPAESKLHQIDPPRLPPRRRDSHKGDYGHVLVIGGAPGKSGAAAMAGLAALRAGAGWVTVTSQTPYPELMTTDFDSLSLEGKSVVAIGPGLGLTHTRMVRELYARCTLPMIVDADALNSLAGWTLPRPPAPRVLTPHPGEFRRLASLDDRLESARTFAETIHATIVLKGNRTIVAHPDGRAYVNPTGSPALAKAGSGDILTGLVAGLYAQHPGDDAVHGAVWLHGRCGELGERRWTEHCLIATDLLHFLPDAIRSAN